MEVVQRVVAVCVARIGLGEFELVPAVKCGSAEEAQPSGTGMPGGGDFEHTAGSATIAGQSYRMTSHRAPRPRPTSRTLPVFFISASTFLTSWGLAAGNRAATSAKVNRSTCASTVCRTKSLLAGRASIDSTWRWNSL